jgi:hypothetical protein
MKTRDASGYAGAYARGVVLGRAGNLRGSRCGGGRSRREARGPVRADRAHGGVPDAGGARDRARAQRRTSLDLGQGRRHDSEAAGLRDSGQRHERVSRASWRSCFDSPEFWNPKMRGPVCYNPAASKSIRAYTLQRTPLALARRSRTQMLEAVRAALARKGLARPEPGAMSLMMSGDGYLGDTQGHWHSHLMFHVPKVDAASWGANLPGSPGGPR